MSFPRTSKWVWAKGNPRKFRDVRFYPPSQIQNSNLFFSLIARIIRRSFRHWSISLPALRNIRKYYPIIEVFPFLMCWLYICVKTNWMHLKLFIRINILLSILFIIYMFHYPWHWYTCFPTGISRLIEVKSTVHVS